MKKQQPGIKVLVLGVLPGSLERQDQAVRRIGPADLQPRVKQLDHAVQFRPQPVHSRQLLDFPAALPERGSLGVGADTLGIMKPGEADTAAEVDQRLRGRDQMLVLLKDLLVGDFQPLPLPGTARPWPGRPAASASVRERGQGPIPDAARSVLHPPCATQPRLWGRRRRRQTQHSGQRPGTRDR